MPRSYARIVGRYDPASHHGAILPFFVEETPEVTPESSSQLKSLPQPLPKPRVSL